MKLRHVLSAALLALAPVTGRAWDAAGHMLVSQIAWEQMQPEVRAWVTAAALPLENTYNEGQPYNFITAQCWMDDMRSKKGYAWSKWHYVNVPWTADGVAFALPDPPHVVWAIGDSLGAIKTRTTTPERLSESLAILTHLVGDVHQPMHATERDDRGGNLVLIYGVPFTDLWPGTVANLHAFWDKAFRFTGRDGKNVELWTSPQVLERPKAPGEGVIAQQALRIMEKFPAASLASEIAQSSPTEWARESHKIGCVSGYPANFIASDHLVVELTPEFVTNAGEIAQRRIALAGYRLGKLLNESMPK